jgi:hypothetical protein
VRFTVKSVDVDVEQAGYGVELTVTARPRAGVNVCLPHDVAQQIASALSPSQVPQPIETAPKDGTVILAWRKTRNRWEKVAHAEWNLWDSKETSWCFETSELTHWLPLPPPPGESVSTVCPNCEQARKALEFYADPNNYLNDCPGEKADEDLPDDERWISDCGHTARAALSTLKVQEPNKNAQ